MEGIYNKFFKGVLTWLPVYSINAIAGDVMKLIEKMVVHSILHCGTGIPIFCEAIYWYFVIGSSEAAAESYSKWLVQIYDVVCW